MQRCLCVLARGWKTEDNYLGGGVVFLLHYVLRVELRLSANVLTC